MDDAPANRSETMASVSSVRVPLPITLSTNCAAVSRHVFTFLHRDVLGVLSRSVVLIHDVSFDLAFQVRFQVDPFYPIRLHPF